MLNEELFMHIVRGRARHPRLPEGSDLDSPKLSSRRPEDCHILYPGHLDAPDGEYTARQPIKSGK